MFRTLYVTSAETITLADNWLIITKDNISRKVPVFDIDTLLLENVHTKISVYALQYLASRDVNIICCDNKQMPSCSVLPFASHYRPYGVLKKQIAMTDTFKDLLWQKIIQAKITNQQLVLVKALGETPQAERLRQLAAEVLPADTGNREAIAAKLYFHGLYTMEFSRDCEDITNKALNYGYSIIRGLVARTLVAYGYNCALGIHHINEANGFNLADDFMEPIRPLVDLWVYKNDQELFEELTKENKRELVNLLNRRMLIANKQMKLHNAVERYIISLTTAIHESDVNKLLIPRILTND